MRKRTITFTAVAPVATLLLCFVVSGCQSKSPQNATEKQTVPAPSGPSTGSASNVFDRKLPHATEIHPLDPRTLSDTQIKFGVAPRRDPSVEYQPDIILMENGDKAIQSIASDGLTWTFDANAPHVSEFQVDKIVFATGRAVGRVLFMQRRGDSVQVILGPVQLTDLIRNGTFEMNEPMNLSNAISYVAPDYPQPSDEDQENSFNDHAPEPHASQRMTLARMSPNVDRRWSSGGAHLLRLSSAGTSRPMFLPVAGTQVRGVPKSPIDPTKPIDPNLPFDPTKPIDPKFPDKLPQKLPGGQNIPGGGTLPGGQNIPTGPSLHMPGVPGVEGIDPLKVVPLAFDPAKTLGDLPLMELAGGKAMALNGSDTSVGMEYNYDKDGLRVQAVGKLILGSNNVHFKVRVADGTLTDCGLTMDGNLGIQLQVTAAASEEFKKNFHKKLYLPIDISIPLGGAVPLSITFGSTFLLQTAFSARTSVLNAKGDYSLGAGLKAGYLDKSWQFQAGGHAIANTDIGDSTEGISVGINSVILGFNERALVGVGYFGFHTGVYAAFIFSGSAAKAPNLTFPCRQGTIDITIEYGAGYSIPVWAANAVNVFLRFTNKTVEPQGTFVKLPRQGLYHKVTQRPEGCVSRGG